MAMNKGDMAKAIIDALKDIDDPSKAMSEFSKALKGYIEDNCEISYSWIATMPPPTPTPDPMTSFDATVTFPVFSIPNPPDMAALGPLILAQIAGGLINPVKSKAPTLVVPPGMFLPIPFMTSQSDADNQKDAMENLADEIISGMKKMINPTPNPGVNPPYVVPTPGAIMTGIS